MPELPEVENVKRALEKSVLGKVFEEPKVFYAPMWKSKNEAPSSLKGDSILSLSREGKFLLFHLQSKRTLLFHLRMEGKLFYVEKENHETKHRTLYLPFEGDDALAFYDVRKFGCCYL